MLRLATGAVATSGLNVRLWRRADGTPAHHLLDPATGDPAWTGVVGATALAPTALEAETLAKAALLSGPPRDAAGWSATAGCSSATTATSSSAGRCGSAPWFD